MKTVTQLFQHLFVKALTIQNVKSLDSGNFKGAIGGQSYATLTVNLEFSSLTI